MSGCDGGKLPASVGADDLAQARDIAVAGKGGYIALAGDNRRGILRCAIDEASGDLQSCADAGDTGSITPVCIALRRRLAPAQ